MPKYNQTLAKQGTLKHRVKYILEDQGKVWITAGHSIKMLNDLTCYGCGVQRHITNTCPFQMKVKQKCKRNKKLTELLDKVYDEVIKMVD